VRVGADEEVPPVDAAIAECRLAKGDLAGALELAGSMIERASESSGIAKVLPLLHRVQGHALLLQDDAWSARDAFEASLAAARERRNVFETALSMTSMIELDRFEGIEPPHDMVEESRAILSMLKVRAIPRVAMPRR